MFKVHKLRLRILKLSLTFTSFSKYANGTLPEAVAAASAAAAALAGRTRPVGQHVRRSYQRSRTLPRRPPGWRARSGRWRPVGWPTTLRSVRPQRSRGTRERSSPNATLKKKSVVMTGCALCSSSYSPLPKSLSSVWCMGTISCGTLLIVTPSSLGSFNLILLKGLSGSDRLNMSFPTPSALKDIRKKVFLYDPSKTPRQLL